MNMTDIEQKALELVNRIARERNTRYPCVDRANDSRWEALCRALEARELDKSRHAAELREQAERFSEAVTGFWNYCKTTDTPFPADLSPFILAPVDPLMEVADALHVHRISLEQVLEARGLAIVKKEAVNG